MRNKKKFIFTYSIMFAAVLSCFIISKYKYVYVDYTNTGISNTEKFKDKVVNPLLLTTCLKESMATTNYTVNGQHSSYEITPNNPKTVTKKIVVVDAGHGGYDPGSIGAKGTKEKDITLSVALKVGAILEKHGINVIYTRKRDAVTWPANEKKDLAARAAISNNVQTELYISIHVNSYNLRSVRGVETYYCKGSFKGRKLAGLIHNQILKEVQLNNRGLRTEDYSILINVKAPAVLVELGYISNKYEEEVLNTPSYQDRFALAIAKGILNFINS